MCIVDESCIVALLEPPSCVKNVRQTMFTCSVVALACWSNSLLGPWQKRKTNSAIHAEHAWLSCGVFVSMVVLVYLELTA